MHTLAQTLLFPDGKTVINGPLTTSTWIAAHGTGLTLGAILSRATLFVFAFSGMGLLLMILMAGFTFLTSAGDPKKLAQAQGQLTNAIIGFIIIFCAFWIAQLLGTIFGIQMFIGPNGVFGK
jgi:hypothetical protein